MTNPATSTKPPGNLLQPSKTAPVLESGANSFTPSTKPATGRIAPADLRAGALALQGGAS
jgi:hypothetical protein